MKRKRNVMRHASFGDHRRGERRRFLNSPTTEKIFLASARAVLRRAAKPRIEWHDISPGTPQQDASKGSRNGRRHDECVHEHVFGSLAEARRLIAAAREED